MSRSSRTTENLTGQRFGRLVVLGRSDKRGSRGARTVPLWECRCDCGNITHRATDSLTKPEIIMCKSCADKYATSKMRENCGFVDGTQLGKLKIGIQKSNNATGVRGVYYIKTKNLYRARIKVKGKYISLGCYKTLPDAIAARKKGEEVYFGEILDSYKKESNNQ